MRPILNSYVLVTERNLAKELNLFIVNLQYMLNQHNNIRQLMCYRNMFRLRRVIIRLNI